MSKEIEQNVIPDIDDNLEFWMGNLPEELKNVPIVNLAIPGSHDSGSFTINENNDIAPDAPRFVRYLNRYLTRFVKAISYKWVVTQSLNTREQLLNGVRYFDLRIATKPGTDELYIVHGMYGGRLRDFLYDIRTYLVDHTKEVVILDFQHFYSFSDEVHYRLAEFILNLFQNKLCPYEHGEIKLWTLNSMLQVGYQVIIIYRQMILKSYLWPSHSFPTPWPNTTKIERLLPFLELGLESRGAYVGLVSQGVLTPDNKMIVFNVCSDLVTKCATPCNHALLPWLTEQTPGPGGVNIVISDFIGMSGIPFCKTVIDLNKKLL